ncbi:MAG: efflux RND transporter periplasmic adaptor subunit [Pseudomonadota bacterium]
MLRTYQLSQRFRLTTVHLWLLSLAVVLGGCQGNESEAPAPVAPLRPVKVVEANLGGESLQRVLSATVISADSQDLSFRISGAITSIPVNVGDRLNQGDIVATVDQLPFELGESEARAALSQATANFRNAQSQYQRTRELYASEAATLSDLENAKANESAAGATLTQAREGLNSARLNLQYSTLLSPSDNCQIVSVPVSVNQNVNAGQTIASIACGNQQRLRTVVPESLINTISLGMPVTANINSGNTLITGTVAEIAVSSDNNAGYPVEIAMDSPPPGVRTGMAAEVTISISNGEERMVLPLVAILGSSSENYVYVAEPQADHYLIERRAVEIGSIDNNGIEILQGLTPGQNVVVAGMSRISEGMKVTLYQAAGQSKDKL